MEKVSLKPQELPEEELDETQTAEWRERKKHIFILSESGKPVYSRSVLEMMIKCFFPNLHFLLCKVLESGFLLNI